MKNLILVLVFIFNASVFAKPITEGTVIAETKEYSKMTVSLMRFEITEIAFFGFFSELLEKHGTKRDEPQKLYVNTRLETAKRRLKLRTAELEKVRFSVFYNLKVLLENSTTTPKVTQSFVTSFEKELTEKRENAFNGIFDADSDTLSNAILDGNVDARLGVAKLVPFLERVFKGYYWKDKGKAGQELKPLVNARVNTLYQEKCVEVFEAWWAEEILKIRELKEYLLKAQPATK